MPRKPKKGFKKCTKCNKTKKIVENFYLDGKGKNKRKTVCKECNKDLWGPSPEEARAARLRQKYDISLEDYNYLLKEQENECAICHASSTDVSLCVDHNHLCESEEKRDSVRGLLCSNCNTALGLLRSDYGPETLQSALEYTHKHHKKD